MQTSINQRQLAVYEWAWKAKEKGNAPKSGQVMALAEAIDALDFDSLKTMLHPCHAGARFVFWLLTKLELEKSEAGTNRQLAAFCGVELPEERSADGTAVQAPPPAWIGGYYDGRFYDSWKDMVVALQRDKNCNIYSKMNYIKWKMEYFIEYRDWFDEKGRQCTKSAAVGPRQIVRWQTTRRINTWATMDWDGKPRRTRIAAEDAR